LELAADEVGFSYTWSAVKPRTGAVHKTAYILHQSRRAWHYPPCCDMSRRVPVVVIGWQRPWRRTVEVRYMEAPIETRSWGSLQVAQRAPVGLWSVRRCGTDVPRYLPSKSLPLRPFDSATVNLESVKSTWLGGRCCSIAPSSGGGGRAHVTTHRSPQGMRDCKSTGSRDGEEAWSEEFGARLPSPYLQRMEWNSIWVDYLDSTHRPSRRCSGARTAVSEQQGCSRIGCV
jgi:hypothetical protein